MLFISVNLLIKKPQPQSKKPMKAIVFADRLGQELAPLTERNCVALLPVASKPLINYTFEMLLAAGIREVTLVISAFAPLMRHNMGNGERWGIQLNYIVSQGEELPAPLLQRQSALLTDDCYLMLRGDMLLNISLNDFFTQITLDSPPSPTTIIATIAKQYAGIAVITRDQQRNYHWEAANMLAWPPTQWSQQPAETVKTIDLTGNYSLLRSPSEYHQINLQASAAQFEHLVLPGTKVADGLMVGHRSNIVRPNRGVIGMFCRIHPTTCLSGGVVIGNESIIDRHVHLHNTVVMPNTYIAPHLELNNSLVWGQLRLDFEPDKDSVTTYSITDYSIADLHRETFGVLLANGVHRMLGLILLLLSLPLWIPAAFLAGWKHRKHALMRVPLFNQQRQSFLTWEWNVNAPILRHLPKLIAVIQGHLRLVGVAPRTTESLQHRQEAWEFVRDHAPIGLFGPAQFAYLSQQPRPACEIAVEEACYAADRDFYRDWRWLGRGWRALWHRATWQS
jgi:mannose-1-phosphate guanylyltransferase / phosphomannomutase